MTFANKLGLKYSCGHMAFSWFSYGCLVRPKFNSDMWWVIWNCG